jgi:hypothetical protein
LRLPRRLPRQPPASGCNHCTPLPRSKCAANGGCAARPSTKSLFFSTPNAIALDTLGRIYVTADYAGALQRMDADGSNLTPLLTSLSAPASPEFGHGALCARDLYFLSGEQIRRVEINVPGASVLWH